MDAMSCQLPQNVLQIYPCPLSGEPFSGLCPIPLDIQSIISTQTTGPSSWFPFKQVFTSVLFKGVFTLLSLLDSHVMFRIN